MEIKDLLMLKKINFGILTLTVGLVMVFGLSVIAGILGSNPYEEARQMASSGVTLEEAEVQASGDSDAASGRQPASVVAAVGTGAATIDFTCLEKKEQHTLQVTSAQMRIRAKLCSDSFDITKTEIVNTSNGYTAVVFKTADQVMSSDYIQLSNGLNHIKIQLQDRHGSLQTSELLVSRSQEF